MSSPSPASSMPHRTSEVMGPPPIPQVGSSARRMSNSSATSESTGPHVPMRHPRPITTTELHSDMEKEQEGIVNRLSRELSALRAHSSSVVSTSSNSSYAVHEGPDLSSSGHGLYFAAAGYPTSSRRHRGSSSSSYSNPPSTAPQPQAQAAPIGSSSQASVDRARDAAIPLARSRQNSTVVPLPLHPQHTGSSSSRPSPAPSPGIRHNHPLPGEGPAFFTLSSHTSGRPGSVSVSSSGASLYTHSRDMSATGSLHRIEDTQAARAALEQARLENEALVRRVKELEREFRRTRRARDDTSTNHPIPTTAQN